MKTRSGPAVPVRGVHLDLKGLPPTFPRLLQLLDLIAAGKFNALLVEWEDAFPWTVDKRFRSETAYTPDQVCQFHARARELNLEIIPLVQCLGHMETPLRPEEYRALREVPDRCDVLNPLAPGARDLVARMINDVLRLSGSISHFHLGGDEAWTFGTHPDTKAYIEKHGKGALYLHHIEPLLDMLNARGVRPILWHDMMHEWDDAALRRIASKADLMFWSYQGHPDDSKRGAFGTNTVERFKTAGIALWGAGAYKGADSRGDADLPDPSRRIVNIRAWTDLAARFNLKGVVATAWSRYSTHRVQNEPIDGALDVLVQTGALLHSNQTLSDDALVEFLKTTREYDRFIACKSALSRLSDARRETWNGVLLLHQQLACEKYDERRVGSGVFSGLMSFAKSQMKAAEDAAADVRSALAGLVDDIWLDRYVYERLRPLRDQLHVLEGDSGTR